MPAADTLALELTHTLNLFGIEKKRKDAARDGDGNDDCERDGEKTERERGGEKFGSLCFTVYHRRRCWPASKRTVRRWSALVFEFSFAAYLSTFACKKEYGKTPVHAQFAR